jgi:phosphate uptake regulator
MGALVGEKRIVQKTGVSTLTVSLPKSWAEKAGVRKGSDVFAIEEPDGSLVLSTKPSVDKRESFDLSVDDISSNEELKRKFYAAYLAGFDLIRLHSSSKITPEFRKVVLQETKRLIGIEVVEESSRLVVVKDFFSSEGLSIQKTLKRMHMITCSLFEDLLDEKELEAVVERDDEVDRLRFLLSRQLHLALKNPAVLRSLELSATKCIDYATITLYVERVADKVTLIAKTLSREKKCAGSFKLIKPHLEKAYSLYMDAVKAFLEKDFDLAMSVINARSPFYAEMDELNKRLWQKETGYVSLLEHTTSILEHTVGIAEQAINQS